jgi:PTS system nitrogen regulatory IIA component
MEAIGDILSKADVRLDLEARSKSEAIGDLCAMAAAALGLEKGPLLEVVEEREQLGSTAVGGGLAIPHGKTVLVDSVCLFMARTAPGFELSDYDTPDGRPVRLLALILSPVRLDPDHLRVLAVLGRLWKSPQNVNLMMAAKDGQSFRETLTSLSGPAAAEA